MFIFNSKKHSTYCFYKPENTCIARKGECRVWVNVRKRHRGRTWKECECEFRLKSERYEEGCYMVQKKQHWAWNGRAPGYPVQTEVGHISRLWGGLWTACTPRKSRTNATYFCPPLWPHPSKESWGQDASRELGTAGTNRSCSAWASWPWLVSDLRPTGNEKWYIQTDLTCYQCP